MQQTDQTNQYFEMASQFVNQTGQHLFLTGKAGTGKTTFLRYIKEHSPKKLAVLAPTGVAAINAGGSTLHSFFQLPFGSFLPLPATESMEGNFYDRRKLLQHLRLNSSKRDLMQELELLIIDEVSMVRADLLDAVDSVLRHIRRQPNLPFGGVQMLYIGDLSQLPPVVNEQDWKVLGNHYQGPFFFHAHALQQNPPLFLELKKIYRQSDETFIRILNNIRNQTLGAAELEHLNSYYRPDFVPEEKGEYITLTTHNAKADIINSKELQKLPGKTHTFDAQVEGEFNESAYPAERKLQLKEGAQIMFIRNDKGENRRFYNGKIGTIKRIRSGKIYVVFPDEEEELLVEKESWKNVRYRYQQNSDQIEEEEKGSFTQFPLRLAWAITIHKSQGLTFHKAIIDAGKSFAAGQVYVALSRLSSLDGLVLYSPIHAHSIRSDEQAGALAENALEETDLIEQLKQAQKEYLHQSLLQVFDWRKLRASLGYFNHEMDNRRIPKLEEAKSLSKNLLQKAIDQQRIADKFNRQLEQMIPTADQLGYGKIHKRVEAASLYFQEAVQKELLTPLQEHDEALKNKSGVKKYQRDLQKQIILCKSKLARLEQVLKTTSGLVKGKEAALLLSETSEATQKAKQEIQKDALKKVSKTKVVKGDSRRLSFTFYREGKSVEDIALERGLSPGTIESHLISFIASGDLEVNELVSEDKIKVIQQVMAELGEINSATQIKEKLSDDFSYGEIRAVMNQARVQNEEEAKVR